MKNNHVVSLARAPQPARLVASIAGHSVEIEDRASPRLIVRSPEGAVSVSIEIGRRGPVLHFEQAELTLSGADVQVDCDAFRVNARSSLELRSEGSISQRAEAELRATAGGTAKLIGHDVRVVSRRGDVAVKANDDVRLVGERIWLNR